MQEPLKADAGPTGSAQPDLSVRNARIAILEGGGMRGYITARFLQELQDRAGGSKCKWWELFDLVVGTSTGGILAALIVSGVSAAEMVDFYKTDGPKIFKRSGWRAIKTFFSSAGSKYDNQTLIECLKTRIPLTTTVGDARPGFMVPTWDGNDDENVYIKSYDEFWTEFPLAYAAIATASAPTYFPGFVPKRLGQPEKYNKYDSRFFDGGFIENNPVTCTLHELSPESPLCPALKGKQPIIINFGTGVLSAKGKKAPDGGWLPWATQVYPRMAALQNKLSERTSKYMIGGGKYIRIDARLDAPIKLDDARPATLAKMEKLVCEAIGQRDENGKPKIDFDELVRLLKT